LLQPVNSRSQRHNLRPQRFQFILWIGHAGKLSHLFPQRKGFVLLRVGVPQGGAGIGSQAFRRRHVEQACVWNTHNLKQDGVEQAFMPAVRQLKNRL
jgi:hypothetical protein